MTYQTKRELGSYDNLINDKECANSSHQYSDYTVDKFSLNIVVQQCEISSGLFTEGEHI